MIEKPETRALAALASKIAMAAVWLKRRKELQCLLDPSQRSQKEPEEEWKLPKELSPRIAEIRRIVMEQSQTVDESDLEYWPKSSAGGSEHPSLSSASPSPVGPTSPQGVLLSSPTSASETGSTTPAADLPSPASPGTVSSGIARRRSSVNLRQPLPDTEGDVIDFLERRRVVATKTFIVKMWQKGQRGILTGDIVVPAHEEMQLITQVLRPPHPDEHSGVSDCRFLVEAEELAAAINWIVTRENKNLEGPLKWPKTSTARFREWVTTLVTMERDCREMERQARCWLMRFKLLYGGVLPETPRDYSFEHRVRVVDFWYEYHKDAWNTRHPGLKRSGTGLGTKQATGPAADPSKIKKQLSTRRMMSSRSQTSFLRDAGTGAVCKLPPVRSLTTERYLKQCNGLPMTPLPMPFMIGETKDLLLAHLDLSDMELLAVAETLPTVEAVQKVDLHGNAMLSDKAVAQLLKRLLAPKLASKLLELSIAGCTRAGANTTDRAIELVSDAFNLQRLDLSGVKIDHHKLLPLCEAISERQTLSFVSLSGTTFGKGPVGFGCQCVTTLLQGHVAELDLSWNQFSSELFCCLGETLAKRKMVKKLNICNCSGGGLDRLSTPVNFYLEELQMDSALTSLDLSMTRMDFRSALILEDALQNHKSLKHLQLSDNPLGPRGLRSILRCVASETNCLQFFDTSGCYGGEEPSINDHEVFKMSDLQGAGSYNLQLHRPYHRSLLRMLYKAAERFHLSPSEVFIVNSEGPFAHGTKKKDGTWEVPREGEVSLSFNLERCLESSIFKGLERDFDTVIKRFYQVTRHQLDEKKAIPVFGRWYDLDGFFHSQTVLLKALSSDFVLSLADLRVLAATSQLAKPKCIINLLPSVLREPGWYFIAQGMYSTTSECVTCRMQLRELINFSTGNPTGHYKLELENRADLAVAEMLRLLDKWEVLMDKKFDRPDISATQNRSHARNIFYQGKPVQNTFADWKLPSHDKLELDYSSSFGPPPTARALPSATFQMMLDTVHNPLCDPAVVVQALKSNSSKFFLSSRQLRQLIGVFERPQHRIELCVTLFNRIMDPEHAKLYRGRIGSFEDLLVFSRRIGMARSFPYMQPEFEQFHFNFHFHDERACISNLLAISSREDPGYIRNPVYILPDGTIDPLKMGIPRSWEMQDRVPVGGTFKCSYVCAATQRNFMNRKHLCKTYHFSDVHQLEKEVEWWTNNREVPSEVIDLALYLKEKNLDLKKVFDSFDGADGNGEVGYIKLIRGLEGLSWPNPEIERSENELKELYVTVFRCLNANGHGTMVRGDWTILQQVTDDIQQTIGECLQYLLRISDGSWNNMWKKLDVEGLGSLNREAWLRAVERLCYFGPSELVFRAARKEGNITKESLRSLEPILQKVADAE
ncbi:unnamed protein product [Durusdinium trenchii]|uniref:Uncharacterized protein n=1 Tax=Durusdinium trenchii TaxID=1381693 RepID=A0ABP0MYQ1_9DINO